MKNRIYNMLKVQINLNKTLLTEDTTLGKIRLAMLEEIGEIIRGLGWKWWKHVKVDSDYIREELVDLWHFVLTYFQVYTINEPLHLSALDTIEEAIEMYDIYDKNEYFTQKLVDFTRHICYPEPDGYGIIETFLELTKYYFKDMEDFEKTYYKKVLINYYRSARNYKKNDGSYKIKELESKVMNIIDPYKYIDDDGCINSCIVNDIDELIEKMNNS